MIYINNNKEEENEEVSMWAVTLNTDVHSSIFSPFASRSSREPQEREQYPTLLSITFSACLQSTYTKTIHPP